MFLLSKRLKVKKVSKLLKIESNDQYWQFHYNTMKLERILTDQMPGSID